ncbi:hypothetical protein BaRGS_00007331 [Batillaria attramentaria]|uniref:G-protein coupled receptors family 1 profile domain-containing protein n=1 Tax=Batillaria attramentaria TaxID=370345 RepID=A0ABD0LPZ7_9CAEN
MTSTPPPPPVISTMTYTNLNHSNTTTEATNFTDYSHRDEDMAMVEVAVSATILGLAIVGNSMVVVSLSVKRGKLSRMHLMMLHLSLADLFVAFFSVLPQMAWDITFRFQGGAFLCGAVKYLQLVTMYASSYVLLSTAIDRYVAICKPFVSQKWTSRHAHLLVFGAWAASLLFSVPQLFIFTLTEVQEGSGVYDCWARFEPEWTLQLYITWNTVSVFIVPSLTLGVLYGHITHAVWKSSKMAEKLAPRYTPQPQLGACQQQDHVANSPGSRQRHFWQRSRETDHILNNGSQHYHGDNRHGATGCGMTENRSLHENQDTSPSALETSPSTGGIRRACSTPHETGSSRQFSMPSPKSSSRSKRVSFSPQPANTTRRQHGRADVGISRAKIKTVKLTVTVIICYLVCWTPFFLAQLWAAYDENAPFETTFFTIVLLLANLNSCTNPWIYMAFSDTICKGLNTLITSLCRPGAKSFCPCVQGNGVRNRTEYEPASQSCRNQSVITSDTCCRISTV